MDGLSREQHDVTDERVSWYTRVLEGQTYKDRLSCTEYAPDRLYARAKPCSPSELYNTV